MKITKSLSKKLSNNETSISRIYELESIRGFAALLVVLYHMPYWNPLLPHVSIFRNFYLMVPLFFVLSGFVIYKAYANKIQSAMQLLRFQFLRFGRLYPVHLLFLFAFLLIELTRWYAWSYGVDDGGPTPFVRNSMKNFVYNLLLVQAIVQSGMDAFSFNDPAWSISLEFYTYLVFGLIVLFVRRIKIIVFLLVALAACVLLVIKPEPVSIISCFAGFFIGCCTAWLSEKITLKLPHYVITLVVLLLIFFLLLNNNTIPITIYLLSAALVLSVLWSQDSYVCKILRLRFFVWLGTISYSVYMSHAAILWVCGQFFWRTIIKYPCIYADPTFKTPLPTWLIILTYFVCIIIVLLVSHLTYNLIEKTWRERSRRVFRSDIN